MVYLCSASVHRMSARWLFLEFACTEVWSSYWACFQFRAIPAKIESPKVLPLFRLMAGPTGSHIKRRGNLKLITPRKSEEVAVEVAATDCSFPEKFVKTPRSAPFHFWQLLCCVALTLPALWFLAFSVYWHDSSFKCSDAEKGSYIYSNW